MEGKTSRVTYDQGLRNKFLNASAYCTINSTVAEGTNDATIKTTTTTPFIINGKFYSKSNTDNITATACAEQALATRCAYLVSINAAGTVKITKGTEVRSATYTAATLAWEQGKKLSDTAKGLSTFRAGDVVLISGFTYAENNGVFFIDFVAADGSYLVVRENQMVDEVLGDSVTVVVGSMLPDLPYMEAPLAYFTIVTGTTAFTVGTDDITDDIGTGSVTFTQLSTMPDDAVG